MSQINQLSTASSLTGSDLIPIFSSSNWDARKASLSALIELVQSSIAAPNVAVQTSTPGTGFDLAIASGNVSTWALIQPAGTLATGTVTLPLNTSTTDGTEVLVTSTQQITALTVGVNGATAVFGAPSSLSANAWFRLKYNLQFNSWYRIA